MASQAGVWIDHKQATVVSITKAGQEIKKITAGLEQPVPAVGSARAKNKYTPHDFIAEDRQQRKAANELKAFFGEVIASLGGAKSILVLGPGGAKGEFSKHIASKKLRGVTLQLETADKMTDRQLAAKVGAHFATAPTSKSVAPKKMAKKKGVSGNPEKRAKKAKK